MAGISDKAAGGLENRYKYNGIELDTSLGLDEYEAALRDLDPQTGRWCQIDPETENQEMWSPYASMKDDPVKYKDPKGDLPCCGTSAEILSKTQNISGAIELIGGGPEDPVADAVSGAVEVVGDLWALGKFIDETLSKPPKAVTTTKSDIKSTVQASSKAKEEAAASKAKARQTEVQHTSNVSKSNSDTHTKRRSGGQYNRNQNNKKGNSNKKFMPKPNPNKYGNQ